MAAAQEANYDRRAPDPWRLAMERDVKNLQEGVKELTGEFHEFRQDITGRLSLQDGVLQETSNTVKKLDENLSGAAAFFKAVEGAVKITGYLVVAAKWIVTLGAAAGVVWAVIKFGVQAAK